MNFMLPGGHMGISTINGSLLISNTLNGVGTGWDVGIGLSTGPVLQVKGSSQFSGSIRVGLFQ